jgi:hypothetical protein
MTNCFVRWILKLGSLTGRLLASSVGCFVFTRASLMVAVEADRSDLVEPMRANGKSSKPLAGISAALFLMAFVTSETLVMIRALYR